MKFNDIIEHLQSIEEERVKAIHSYYQEQSKREYLELAIAQLGLTQQVEERIKKIKESEEVPF